MQNLMSELRICSKIFINRTCFNKFLVFFRALPTHYLLQTMAPKLEILLRFSQRLSRWSTPNFLNWHNVEAGSGVDPGMVVEVVEAVLMAEAGEVAEVAGKGISVLEFTKFSCIQLPRTEFLVFGLRGSAENIHRYLDRDHFKKFCFPSQYCAFQ